MVEPGSRPSGWRRWLVSTFWASHNDSPWVRQALRDLVSSMGGSALGLNVGSGETSLDPRFLNVDLHGYPSVDCLTDVHWLPFKAGTFEAVVSQEVVEHVPDPFRAVQEMSRVLSRGGRLYLQVPFVIGYHPGPEDYWRFTRAGVEQLLKKGGLACELISPSVGPGTGLYRVLVEFTASSAARLLEGFYLPVKGVCAVLFFPLRWLDRLLLKGPQRDRIAGGYFAIGRKG